jgi:DNA-binding response OmpR family regulator
MKNGKKILLVDDDDALRTTLSEQLQEDFDVSQARTGAEALSRASSDLHDIIVLDVGLPDVDGRDVCRQLRQSGVRTPVIMLTAADSEADTIKGLDSGANDYVSKPFRIGILLARIRAQLRQYERSEDAIFAIGPYSFRPSAKLLVHKDTKKKLRLTEKEASILKYLLRAGSIVIGREILLNEVWGYNSGVTTHTLETHVYRLRQKIERDPSKAELLVTEQGGYRLIP